MVRNGTIQSDVPSDKIIRNMDPVILPQKKKAQLEFNHDGIAGKMRDILQQNWLEIFKVLKGEGREGRVRGRSRLWRIHATHTS